MDNLEMVRWELKDRTSTHERLAEEMRMDAELVRTKPGAGRQLLVLPLLASVAGLLAWLVIH